MSQVAAQVDHGKEQAALAVWVVVEMAEQIAHQRRRKLDLMRQQQPDQVVVVDQMLQPADQVQVVL
jgi:hypothetical protein